MIGERDDIVALDSAIIQHPRTWEASGHLAGFTDPLVDCKTCGQRFRADHLGELAVRAQAVQAPGRDARVRPHRGARVQPHVRDDDRPGEGGRRDRLPAPRDRAGHLPGLQDRPAASRARSRRSASPRSASRSATRSRPATSSSARSSSSRWRWSSSCRPTRPQQWHEHWLEERMDWYVRLGIRPDHLKLRPHDADELSHYSSATSDVEYLYPIGWSELEGIANRGDFDLTQHAEYSGEKLEYFDPQSGERYVPHVIEPAAGVGRAMLAVPVRRLRRGGGRRRAAHACCKLHPRAGADQGRRAAARAQGRPARARARGLRRRCAARCRPSTTRAARSASATAARTRSARRAA